MTDPRDAADGPPSAARRDVFADRLGRELDASRLAWDAATLRSDAALASGDADSVRRALDDHRLLLEILEARIGEVVADTPGVAPDVTAPDLGPRASGTGETRAATGDATPGGNRWVRTYLRVSALVGAAAAVALVVTVGTGGTPAGPDTTIARSDLGVAEVERELETRTAGEDVRGFGAAVAGTRGATPEPAERSLTPLEPSATVAPTGQDDRDGGGAVRDADPRDEEPPPADDTDEPEGPAGPDEHLDDDAAPRDLQELLERFEHDGADADQDVASSGSGDLEQLTSELAPRSPEAPASDPTTGLR